MLILSLEKMEVEFLVLLFCSGVVLLFRLITKSSQLMIVRSWFNTVHWIVFKDFSCYVFLLRRTKIFRPTLVQNLFNILCEFFLNPLS